MNNRSQIEREVAEAWLVTAGLYSAQEFVAIFDFRLSGEAMRLIVDQIYRMKYLSPVEQMADLAADRGLFSSFALLNDGSLFEESIVCLFQPSSASYSKIASPFK